MVGRPIGVVGALPFLCHHRKYKSLVLIVGALVPAFLRPASEAALGGRPTRGRDGYGLTG